MRSTLAVALVLLCSVTVGAEEPTPALDVSGDIQSPGSVALAQLQALGSVTAAWKLHGRTHQVTGVPLQKLLESRGFSPGREGKDVLAAEKHQGWRRVLVAVGADGYQVAFSCAEVSAAIGATKALVVWSIDGRPLEPEVGPLRLVALTDKEGARSVFRLKRIVVVDVTQPFAP